MKKEIICGVCAVAFLLLITPTIPAQQSMMVKNTIEKDFQRHLDGTIYALKNMVEGGVESEYQKVIAIASFNEIKQIWEHGGLDVVPTYFKSIIHTLLSFILAIVGTILGIIFGKLFGPLLVFIVKVITFPAILLAKILEFFFEENRLIVA